MSICSTAIPPIKEYVIYYMDCERQLQRSQVLIHRLQVIHE